jgi:hypothetical protein
MKRITIVLMAVLATCYMLSCKKDDCTAPFLKKISFYTNNSLIKVSDTDATIVKARKGSSFGQISNTYMNVKMDKNKALLFPEKGTETYDYDWKITLHPSNREYRITALEHDDHNSHGGPCVSTVTYRLNDSSVIMYGNPYSATPYETPDIKILYQ